MARDDFPFGVVLWLVGEGGRGPKAASRSSSSAFSIGFHRRRPQVGVVHIALRSVGEELAVRPQGAGCWLEEGVLTKADWSEQARRTRQ